MRIKEVEGANHAQWDDELESYVDIFYKSKVWCDDELGSYFDWLYKTKIKTLCHEITWEKVPMRTVKFFSLFENWISTEKEKNRSFFLLGYILRFLKSHGHSAKEYLLKNIDNSGSQCTQIFTANILHQG